MIISVDKNHSQAAQWTLSHHIYQSLQRIVTPQILRETTQKNYKYFQHTSKSPSIPNKRIPWQKYVHAQTLSKITILAKDRNSSNTERVTQKFSRLFHHSIIFFSARQKLPASQTSVSSAQKPQVGERGQRHTRRYTRPHAQPRRRPGAGGLGHS